MKIKVYIASAYSDGNQADNVRAQIDMSDDLMSLGFIPFVPTLMHFQHMIYPRSYNDWLKYCYEWVGSCDCVLRLEGKSEGATMEVEHAKRLGKKVFYDIVDLEYYYMERI